MANPRQIYERNSQWRKGVYRTLATAVIVNGYVCTNVYRAKELRSVVDRLITLAKKGTLESRRMAARTLRMENTKEGVPALTHLFDQLSERYRDRAGGYTRVIRIAARRGDNTPMAIVELV